MLFLVPISQMKKLRRKKLHMPTPRPLASQARSWGLQAGLSTPEPELLTSTLKYWQSRGALSAGRAWPSEQDGGSRTQGSAE